LRKEFPLEMVMHAERVAREILFKLTPKGALVFSERKVLLDWIHPDFGGTLDVSIVEEFGTLNICDLKYGRGLVVEPESNLQLLSYALAVAHEYHYNFYKIALTILQPRIPHTNGLVRTWTIGVDELKEYEALFAFAIDRCEAKNPEYRAGEHCRFCRAKDICKEFPNAKYREACSDFDDLDLAVYDN
jgi:hypothetical protein